jgi:hypothetical protein
MCERCHERPPTCCVVDLPDTEAMVEFGNEIVGLLICDPCLSETEREGEWDMVVDLSGPVGERVLDELGVPA